MKIEQNFKNFHCFYVIEKVCRLPGGGDGICVDSNKCSSIEKLGDFVTEDDIRNIRDRTSRCSLFGRVSSQLCCEPNIIPIKTTPLDPTLHQNYNLFNDRRCGSQSSNRVANGEAADLNEFPWMALLQYRVENVLKFHCGGSLINGK